MGVFLLILQTGGGILSLGIFQRGAVVLIEREGVVGRASGGVKAHDKRVEWGRCGAVAIGLQGQNPSATDVHGEFVERLDRKSTRLNSSHANISYAVFCLKKKTKHNTA